MFYSHILDTPVTDRGFLEQLHELNHKINFVKEQSFRDAKSCLDVRDILEKLKIKVGTFNHQYYVCRILIMWPFYVKKWSWTWVCFICSYVNEGNFVCTLCLFRYICVLKLLWWWCKCCQFQAIAKIREFLLQKINVFKKPMANYQIPQDTMLKFR